MLILQVLALVAQTTSIGGDDSKLSIEHSADLEHYHPFDTAVSLEATQGKDGRIEVTVSANMDSELSLEIRSPDILDMPLNSISQHELSSGDHLSFNITKYPLNGEVNIIIVANAMTSDGYSFREQMTITEDTLLPGDECYFRMTLAEAIAEGCAESTIRPKSASSKTGTSSYVTGKFEYEDREFDETGFTGVNPYLPIRMADVEVFDNSTGTVLATTHTNNQGVFNTTISLTTATDVAARVLTSSEGSQRLFNQAVTKTPSTGGTVYNLTSSTYANNQPGADIDFTSAPVQAISSGVAGAFNIFDMAEYSESYVENLTSQVAPLNLTLYWTAGEGTTGSKWYDLNGHVYLCGTSDDDDSYDDVVILHEIGHYIHISYSGSPDYYGGHSLTGTYDLRLGFTEGVGTFFAGAIRDYMGLEKPLIYIETTGTTIRFWGYSISSNTDTIGGYSNSTFTAMDAGNEATVGHVIFDLVDDTYTDDGSPGVDDDSISLPNLQGDQMVWDVFIAIKDNETSTGVVNGTRISLETFYDYWTILHPSYASAFQQILLDHDVEYQEDAMESDDSSATATWIETDGSTYHHTYFAAGDEDWSKFNATSGTEYLVKTRNLANGADTFLRIYDTDGTTLLSTNDDESSDSVASAIQFTASADATYYIRTNRSADAIPIGKYGDFDLTIYDINHPVITSLSPSTGSVNGGYQVEITGENFGSGASVLFGVYAASDVTLNNATSLHVTVPANVPGLTDITIINALTSDGITPQGTLTDGFEYTGSPLDPSISSISPDFGDYSGSTEVTILGDYLIDGLSTALGSSTLSSVTVVDAKTIQATVQSVPRGVHTVTVTNPNGGSSSIVNGFESALTEIATSASTFVSGSPLQNSITITEGVRMSDLYVHVNVSHPIVPARLNLTLETPSGKMIALFDEIQVANEAFFWKSGFDSIFGYNDYPSEALYQLKGESSLGSWTLHASSSSSSTNTLHSWGLTFLEYRHRDHADQVYCAAEYRNHVMSFDSVSGDLLFRSKFVGSFDYDVAVSHDGRYLYSPGGSYHDGTSWENSVLNVYDAWTGEIISTYQLAGKASPNSLAPVPNGNLIVVTSTQLYLIDISGQSIDANISLTFNSVWETYAAAVNPQGTIVYVTNKDEKLLQTYSLPTLAHLGNISTGSLTPFDVDISSDGSFGVMGYEEDFIAEFHTSNLSIYSNHSAGTGRASIALNPDDSEVYAGWFQSSAGFSHLDLQTGISTQHSDGYGSTNGVYILGDRVYISEWGGNRIIVWDPSSMSEVATIDLTPVDGYRCRGITAAEPPGLLTPNITASSNSLTLSWSAPSSGPAVTEYRVYKGDSPGNESFHATVSSSILTYTDTSVAAGVNTHYRVTTVMQGIGEGPISLRLTCYAGAASDGDLDLDGICDDADEDVDGDGVANSADAFPLDPSEDTDTDSDGIGNNADTDDDGDGWSDDDETLCSTNPTDSNSVPSDADSDGICDSIDSDLLEAGFQDGSVFTRATLSAGGSAACAILDNASLQCWGANSANKLGSGSGGSTPLTSNLGSGRTAVATAMGFYNSCAILDDGSVKCWGQGNGGGSGSTVSIGSGRIAVSITAGFDHACAILDNASLLCWGGNSNGQLGDGTTSSASVSSPVGVDLGANRTVAAVSAGNAHTCAILDNASLVCWGDNAYGQLGDGTTSDSSTPVNVDVGSGRFAVAVSGGKYHTCAILDDGSLECWGYNGYGQLGYGTWTSSSNPVSVDLGTGTTAVSIANGQYHTCAVLSDATLKCWGYGYDGQLGDGDTSSSNTPVSVAIGSVRSVLAVAAGSGHTCAIMDNMSVQCWGSNSAGQLGDGTTTDSTTPTYVSLANGSSVAVSERDLDGDSTLNIFDTHFSGDDDGDGVVDTDDDYPNNPARWISCPAGSYGRLSCTDSIAGHYIPNNGSLLHTSQLECSLGTYQPSTGQSSCLDASSGHYVDITAATNQTACPAGTYNPNNGSTNSTACIAASLGYYVPSAGSANQTAASPGYYVSTSAATNQTACPFGTYNPNAAATNLSACLNASPGHYVDSNATAAPSQTACPAGTYNPSAGATNYSACIEASIGYYVPSAGSANQTAASPGNYVDSTAATNQIACSPGTYQPNSGESYCLHASPGYYVPSSGSANQTAASPGNYVYDIGSTNQTACNPGAYQPYSAQTNCLSTSLGYYAPNIGLVNQTAASPGHYVSDIAATNQTACNPGSYQPLDAQPSCLDASPGYYVPSAGSAIQIEASAGYYVPNSGAISQIQCSEGSYQASTGQLSCILADGGHYVNSMGATSQAVCAEGTYQPETGQISCLEADAGHYIDSIGATTQATCSVGTYQPNTGSTTCLEAEPGFFISSEGSAEQMPAPLDHYTEDFASTSPTSCPENFMTFEVGTNSPDYCFLDTDGDRDPDSSDYDDDDDGKADVDDFCSPGEMGWSSGQVEDSDGDGCRDSSEDEDDDNDGFADSHDDFPFDPTEHKDTDGDGTGDNVDFDDDDDRVSDSSEYDIGTDPLDSDTDDDGYSDKEDVFPLDSEEWADTDGDGIGDNSDFVKTMARYQTQTDVMLDLGILAVISLAATIFLRSRRTYDDEEE